MKPYDRISRKAVANTIFILLALLLSALVFGRPLIAIGHWLHSSSDYIGFAFCNPTLWAAGLDDFMFPSPPPGHTVSAGVAFTIVISCVLSLIVHVVAVIFTVIAFIDIWKRINPKY